jgi:sec-independent protein translocase protein TatB
MPSFSDSIFLFILALLLFGPKRLPVLARELGKWVGEFRRASNEFKMQMEEELRLSEQADRQKQIAAIEAAAPIAAPIAEPEHPHLPSPAANEAAATEASSTAAAPGETAALPAGTLEPPQQSASDSSSMAAPADVSSNGTDSANATGSANDSAAAGSRESAEVLPIATSGELRLMPPSTGLPTPQRAGAAFSSSEPDRNPLGGLLDSIPEAPDGGEASSTPRTETAAQ